MRLAARAQCRTKRNQFALDERARGRPDRRTEASKQTRTSNRARPSPAPFGPPPARRSPPNPRSPPPWASPRAPGSPSAGRPAGPWAAAAGRSQRRVLSKCWDGRGDGQVDVPAVVSSGWRWRGIESALANSKFDISKREPQGPESWPVSTSARPFQLDAPESGPRFQLAVGRRREFMTA